METPATPLAGASGAATGDSGVVRFEVDRLDPRIAPGRALQLIELRSPMDWVITPPSSSARLPSTAQSLRALASGGGCARMQAGRPSEPPCVLRKQRAGHPHSGGVLLL